MFEAVVGCVWNRFVVCATGVRRILKLLPGAVVVVIAVGVFADWNSWPGWFDDVSHTIGFGASLRCSLIIEKVKIRKIQILIRI